MALVDVTVVRVSPGRGLKSNKNVAYKLGGHIFKLGEHGQLHESSGLWEPKHEVEVLQSLP